MFTENIPQIVIQVSNAVAKNELSTVTLISVIISGSVILMKLLKMTFLTLFSGVEDFSAGGNLKRMMKHLSTGGGGQHFPASLGPAGNHQRDGRAEGNGDAVVYANPMREPHQKPAKQYTGATDQVKRLKLKLKLKAQQRKPKTEEVGWKKCYSPSHQRSYFTNMKTGARVWNLAAGEMPMAPGAAAPQDVKSNQLDSV